MDSRHASGLDIIGHTEQVSLMARILDDQDEDCDSDDDFAAPSYGGEKAFESSWLPTSDGRSWGMPPTDEERGREAARRRKESETRSARCVNNIMCGNICKCQILRIDVVGARVASLGGGLRQGGFGGMCYQREHFFKSSSASRMRYHT